MKRSLFCTVAVAGLSLAASTASAAMSSMSYNFDAGATDYANSFKVPAGQSGGTYSTTGGIGSPASGGVLPPGGSNAQAFWGSSTDGTSLGGFDPGETVTLSTYFKFRNGGGHANDRANFVLNASDDGNVLGGQYLGITVNANTAINATTSGITVGLIGRQGGGVASSSGELTGGVGLVDNTWVQVVADITENATTAGQFDASIKLFNWGLDGVTGGTQVGSTFNTSLTGLTTVASATDLYAGFQIAALSGGGARAIDNLSVIGATQVPEPTALAVLGLAGVLGLSRRRAM